MFLSIVIVTVAVILLFFGISKFYLSGPDLSKYDAKDITFFYDGGADVSSGQGELKAFLAEHYEAPKGLSQKDSLKYLRKGYEYQGRTRTFDCEFKEDIASFGGCEVPGEWTIPEGCDPLRRILFLHGGAFIVGSPVSHRPITVNLANRTGCAVFAPHYRLGPENKRMDGILDCRAAYHWILENGPIGTGAASHLAVAGDSAGGNLALMLANWSRDQGLRAPDCVVAMSPVTDGTGASPSMSGNLKTDVVLGKALAPLIKLPLYLRVWVMMLMGKISPANKAASPIFDDLHDLPPTLIQASNIEVLFDDARRYTAKAKQAGSPVELQIWRGQAHVWQHYDTMIPEAAPALDEIAKFMSTHQVGKGH